MAYFDRGSNSVHGPDPGLAPPGPVPAISAQGSNQVYFQTVATAGRSWNYPTQPYRGIQPLVYVPTQFNTNTSSPDDGFPGCRLKNETGGFGIPPGYYYLFPHEHTKIHVFKTAAKPWQSNMSYLDASTFVKLYVPTNITTKELMQGLGCCNDDGSKNILYECVEKGNGQWAAGMRFRGDDKDRMKTCIKNWGWNTTRTGHFGQPPVVWLWVTSDGD